MSPQSSPGHLHYQEVDNHRNTHGQLDADTQTHTPTQAQDTSRYLKRVILSFLVNHEPDTQWLHEVAALLLTMHYSVPRFSFLSFFNEEHCTRLLIRVMGVLRRVPC